MTGQGSVALEKALAAFAAAVGEEHVTTAPERLVDFHDPFSFDEGETHRPSAVVSPGSVEEVQAIVRLANEHRVPLWVVSTGRNLGYGGGAPRVNGSVIVELSRMNRILEVDDQLCFALLEPGVRFFDLYQHVRERGLKVWISVPGLGWGSVIGNSLERGFGYTPYGEHSNQQCGMEVVLPDGELMRTGMGAISNANSWQLYRPGFGPSLDGLFQQSNLGIVTKMGKWLMPAPECFMSVAVRAREEKMLGDLVDTIRPLKIDGTIQSTLTIRSPLHLATKLSRRSDWWQGKGAVPDEIIENEIMPRYDIAWWNMDFGLYGPEALVDARFEIVKQAFAKLPGVEIETRKYDGASVSEETIDRSDLHRAGIPNLTPFSALKWRGENGGTIAFAPISPLNGADAMRQLEMVRRLGREYGFDYYGSFNAGVRHMNHVFQIFFDRDSPEDMAALREMFPRLVEEAAAAGYAEYRAHIGYMDTIGDVYSFNRNALRRCTERLKDMLDPNGILSPGKQGIWPAATRPHGN